MKLFKNRFPEQETVTQNPQAYSITGDFDSNINGYAQDFVAPSINEDLPEIQKLFKGPKIEPPKTWLREVDAKGFVEAVEVEQLMKENHSNFETQRIIQEIEKGIKYVFENTQKWQEKIIQKVALKIYDKKLYKIRQIEIGKPIFNKFEKY